MSFTKILRISVYLLLLLLAIHFVNAEDVSFKTKDRYKAFETVQLDVKINNISLSKYLDVSNLVLLRNDNSSISLAKNIIKLSNDHYIFYFDVPDLSHGEYSLGLINVNYVKDGISRIGRFFTKLNILEGKSQIISIRPAYVYSNVVFRQEASFTLFIKNSGNDTVNINLDKDGEFFNIEPTKFNLLPGITKSVSVSTSLFSRNNISFNGLIKINYGTNNYEIPFFAVRTDLDLNKTPEFNNTLLPDKKINEQVNYSGLYLTTLSDKKINNLSIEITAGEYYPFENLVINNYAGIDLHELKYSIVDKVKYMFDIRPSDLSYLAVNDTFVFLFGLNESYPFTAGFYEGFLKVNNKEGVNLSIPLSLKVTGKKYANNINESLVAPNKTNISYPVSIGREKEGYNFGIWILLLFIIFLFLIVIYFVYRKTKKKKDEFDTFVDKVKGRRGY